MPLEFIKSIEEVPPKRTQNNNEHPYKDISNPKNIQRKPTSPFRNITEKKKEKKKNKGNCKGLCNNTQKIGIIVKLFVLYANATTTYNLQQNIYGKIRKVCKTEQDQKTLISLFSQNFWLLVPNIYFWREDWKVARTPTHSLHFLTVF